jgi:excisionase family DNA binding protein
MSEPRLWTVDEVADYLALAKKTVYRLVETGQLKSLRISNRRRLRPEDVEEWIRQQQEDNGDVNG